MLLMGIGSGSPEAARFRHARRALMPRVRFGIYPGGGAGTIGPEAAPMPEDSAKRLAALRLLRGRHPFVLHLYVNYTGADGVSAVAQLGRELAQYERAGFQIELVLCYRPRDGGSSGQVAGFAKFAKDAVESLGSSRDLVSLQVTNEANVAGSTGMTDGSYRDARDALVTGVIAAQHEALHLRFSWLKVGFNWSYETGRGQPAFWRYLHRRGGAAFARAVGWVGLDVYPGTWGLPIDVTHLARSTATAMRNALRSVRLRYIPLAGLRSHVGIHVSENGYPTGPGRTPLMQAAVMRAAISAIHAASRRYNITDYRWFDLRDANSAGASFEDRYGLLYDDYSPKPAFETYRELIATDSGR
jgi:hypothetical protein